MTQSDPFAVPVREVKRRWADGALVYQVYPRSFQDSNGDGIGDLPGIIERLDYLQELGVGALWLSPFYPSPMADFGYDVADYCDVDPMFGTLDDFKRLQAEAERRDIRIMIDLVPNHTSDEHQWFRESKRRNDSTNPFRDWYVWRDGVSREYAEKHGHDISPETGARPATNGLYPPNNWRDVLTGGPAWEWCEDRQQFYLHSFDVRQPDLNWSNPAVREAIKSAMRFWLDRGVDGFRVDAVYWMAKEPLLSDDIPDPQYEHGKSLPYHAIRHDNSRGWPAVYAYLSEMADVLKEEKYADKQRFMVTEAYPEGHNPLVEYLNFYVGMDPQVAAPFNFEGLGMPWKAASWRKFLRAFHKALPQIDPHCVPSYAFGNHDQPRLASRLGELPSRAAAVLLLTLPGMVFVYNGEELGMLNGHIPRDMVQDPAAKGDASTDGSYGQGRDPERTPMQWSAGHQAGFSSAERTWLPVAEGYQALNAENQATNPDSYLSLYRLLGQLRAQSPTLRHGYLKVFDTGQPAVLGYRRISAPDEDEREFVVLINFSDQSQDCQLETVHLGAHIASSYGKSELRSMSEDGTDQITLKPYEAGLFAAAPLS